MDEIEQLRSDLENAVLERDKALAEATGILQALDASTAENLRLRAELARYRRVEVSLGMGDHLSTLYVRDDHV